MAAEPDDTVPIEIYAGPVPDEYTEAQWLGIDPGAPWVPPT